MRGKRLSPFWYFDWLVAETKMRSENRICSHKSCSSFSSLTFISTVDSSQDRVGNWEKTADERDHDSIPLSLRLSFDGLGRDSLLFIFLSVHSLGCLDSFSSTSIYYFWSVTKKKLHHKISSSNLHQWTAPFSAAFHLSLPSHHPSLRSVSLIPLSSW